MLFLLPVHYLILLLDYTAFISPLSNPALLSHTFLFWEVVCVNVEAMTTNAAYRRLIVSWNHFKERQQLNPPD